jgi:hypothetical protein
MQRRLVLIIATFLLAAFTFADEPSYMGIYLQGQKIGYSVTSSEKIAGGKMAVDATTVIKSAMLGAEMSMNIDTKSVYKADGGLEKSVFTMTSGGRTMLVTSAFSADKIIATESSGGAPTKHEIPIPKGTVIVDDPTMLLDGENSLKPGEVRKFTVFDPPSLSLVEMSARLAGNETINLQGKSIKAKIVKIDDPRSPMTLYLDDKNELLKMVGPMGMEMYPESKKDAMDMTARSGQPSGGTDLADASSIKPDKPITASNSRTSLTIRMTGVDLSKTPSGDHQTVRKDGDGWLITIHPVDPRDAKPKFQIGHVPAEYQQWIQPDLRIPSDSAEFKKKAASIVGGEKDVVKAAEKIRQFVYKTVRVNAGIGVLRDASEVLETCEGVCRDHAVLNATLCRAAGIPTRLVNGMVYAEGRFWYHAWVEIYDGDKWYGMDSTRPSPRLTAGHLKTSEGTVAQALTSFLLDGAKIAVVEGAPGASGN